MLLTNPTTAQSVASSMLGPQQRQGKATRWNATSCSDISYIFLRSELHLALIGAKSLLNRSFFDGAHSQVLTLSLDWFWLMCTSSESGLAWRLGASGLELVPRFCLFKHLLRRSPICFNSLYHAGTRIQEKAKFRFWKGAEKGSSDCSPK